MNQPINWPQVKPWDVDPLPPGIDLEPVAPECPFESTDFMPLDES